MENIVAETGKRGENEDAMINEFKENTLFNIMTRFYENDDEGVIVDKIKASVYHKADYVDLAIKDFIANI